MTTDALKGFRRFAARAEEPEWLVWLLVAVMLAVGLGARAIVVGQRETFQQDNMSLRYPADWSVLPVEGDFDILTVGEGMEAGLFPARVRVQQMPVTEVSTSAQTLGDLALKWSNQQSEALLGYKVFTIEPTTVAGQEAVKLDFAYVAEPAMSTPNSIPLVARGEDILLRQGDRVMVISLVAGTEDFDRQVATLRRILSSLVLK